MDGLSDSADRGADVFTYQLRLTSLFDTLSLTGSGKLRWFIYGQRHSSHLCSAASSEGVTNLILNCSGKYTIVWTVSVEFITCFQRISGFSESFSHKRNSTKINSAAPIGQSRRDEMSIETAYPPSPKPRKGGMCIVLKLSKL